MVENVIKVENASSICTIQCKKNVKGQNSEVMKFNLRQLILSIRIEIAALK